MERGKLSNSLYRFETAIGVFRLSDNRSVCNSKQCDMRNGIQILRHLLAMYPQSLLTGTLESGIVPLDFSPHCVNFLECHAFTVDR